MTPNFTFQIHEYTPQLSNQSISYSNKCSSQCAWKDTGWDLLAKYTAYKIITFMHTYKSNTFGQYRLKSSFINKLFLRYSCNLL